MKAKLALANGAVFTGESFGAEGETAGEVVFNTSMIGYQEVLTDPSYCGQIVTMTYPHMGNYGINPEDFESSKPQVAGFVVREYSKFYSNFRATESLGDFLKRNDIVGIEAIDTRKLTRMIREAGAMNAVISTTDLDDASLVRKAKAFPSMSGLDLAKIVTTKKSYRFPQNGKTDFKFRVVAYDYGIKSNILRKLYERGCDVTVVPANTSADEVLKMDPDGIFLSNGPGDPAAVTYGIDNIGQLIGKKPIFGICLGHQILALAAGAKTFKMKFGHRGANHPVKRLSNETVEVTSHNHGFAVDPNSLPADYEVTHIDLNDDILEGFRHKSLPLFCVQYHPEASPGPHDSDYLFDDFIKMMEDVKVETR
ncbi:MAG: glutamine-hydrolyzing carbamoyl-phosphate synthase small subunit [Bacteroidetes bacterium]|nr:glutamine-hydrolyzing carbamoyl-phosphate synthase small subunit [Bacteroidota bacterium]MCL5034409.1 glutamine-hydrolyzing carbamoyl-phosphate synthase small subunit [Bacteroidota bacterium]